MTVVRDEVRQVTRSAVSARSIRARCVRPVTLRTMILAGVDGRGGRVAAPCVVPHGRGLDVVRVAASGRIADDVVECEPFGDGAVLGCVGGEVAHNAAPRPIATAADLGAPVTANVGEPLPEPAPGNRVDETPFTNALKRRTWLPPAVVLRSRLGLHPYMLLGRRAVQSSDSGDA